MSYNCCPGNVSSCSLEGYQRYPSSSCGSSSPSNLVYRTDPCSPSTCQLGSSLYSGCRETRYEPTSCRTSCMVSSPCQTSCSRPSTSTLCSPCGTTYSGSTDFGSRSCRSLSCGSSGFRPIACRVQGFPSMNYGSQFCHPSFLTSRTFQSSCYRPVCRSGFY